MAKQNLKKGAGSRTPTRYVATWHFVAGVGLPVGGLLAGLLFENYPAQTTILAIVIAVVLLALWGDRILGRVSFPLLGKPPSAGRANRQLIGTVRAIDQFTRANRRQ
ncbi:MAG TPA: hypothetical protein VGI81_07675 [Tepidisphaeraceae bacterium]|jgi:hypothetical protein